MSRPNGKRSYSHIAEHWRDWFRSRQYDIAYQDEVCRTFLEQITAYTKGEEFKRLSDISEEMIEERWENFRKAVKIQQSECPIGFFEPSWEQAQIINTWSPEFDPDAAPNGYQSTCVFSANRIGKTAAVFISVLLWMLPNDPEWDLFQERIDPPIYNSRNDPKSGIKRASRGKFRVFQRPDWRRWRRTGKLILPQLSDTPMDPCDAWHGCDSDTTWNDRIKGSWGGKDGYLAWLPRSSLARRSDGGEAVFKQERRIELKTGHTIFGKTFGAEDAAWAGKAARIMSMDEGFEEEKLIESRTRLEAGGYYNWAYTPTDARNMGNCAQVAYRVFDGQLPLVGKIKFFINFKMEDAPEHVLPAEKRDEDMAAFKQLGAKGRVRMEGGFYSSSPNVFTNFNERRNVLPIDGADALLAIRGGQVTRWVEELGKSAADHLQWSFLGANIIRGMDEGTANPTACVWTAILKTGEMVSFREWEEAELSISERCENIVARSGNTRRCLNPEQVNQPKKYREEVTSVTGMKVRRTFADSKLYKRDPEMLQDNWSQKYHDAGLRIDRATNIGPAMRCDAANDMLRGEAVLKHLIYSSEAGCRAYVTRDCVKVIERLKNYLQQQIATGQRAGEFTGNPETKDDHTVDAFCYCWCSKLKWRNPAESQNGSPVARDRMTGAIVR